MIPSLKTSTKSAGLIARPPNTNNETPVLPTSTNPNFRGSNKKSRRQPWKRNSSSIRCHCTPEKRMLQGSMYRRRQLLLASTSLPLKPQQLMPAMPPPPDFTNYHKLANAVEEAEKFKNSPHGNPEINDVFSWLTSPESLKPPNSKSPDELFGVAAVPPAQQLLPQIKEKEVVTARVRRPAALKRTKDKEEELVLEGIEVRNEKPLCFHVYIKLEQEDDEEEEELYAGTFTHMPPPPKQQRRHSSKQDFDQKRARRCCLRLGMNGMLNHRPEMVTVKLVPTFKADDDPIKVASIFIDST